MRKRSEVGKGSPVPEDDAEALASKKDVVRELGKSVVFPSANAATEVPMSSGFERIVETVFIKDVWETYEKLEAKLRIGDERKDYGRVMRELDDAEGNARLAHRLWSTAMVAREEWELRNEVIFAAMKKEAHRQLQDDKDAGHRSKMITDADVTAQVALIYPDEYQHQEVKRKKVKAMEKSMEDLAAKWDSRCRTLATLATKLR